MKDLLEVTAMDLTLCGYVFSSITLSCTETGRELARVRFNRGCCFVMIKGENPIELSIHKEVL